MKTLAFINLKGGTGKTVSAANMAHILATVHHKKVLLVDGDKQGSVSQYFQVYGEHDGTAALWSEGTPVTLEDVRKWKPAEREQPKTERTEPKPAEDGQEYKPGAYVRTEPTKMTTVPPDGKIVDFPAPVSPPPVEDAPPEETGREQEKDIEWAALMLKTLRNYCETMAAVKGGQTVPWAEYAEAVGIAIAALRK